MTRTSVTALAFALCAGGGIGLRAWRDTPFWIGFVVTALALLLNGLIATWEDEQPGGFNNPKPPK